MSAAHARDQIATYGTAAAADADLLAAVLGRELKVDLPLAALRDAEQAELERLVGRRAAVALRAAFELGRRAVGERPVRGRRLAHGADVWAHFRARLALLPVEEFWSVSLDVRHRVLSERCHGRGTLSGVDVHPRDVFRPLIRESAAAVIFCHNHPSGDATPSRQDVELTARLRQVGEVCGIAVLDHVVVAAEGYASLADRNWT